MSRSTLRSLTLAVACSASLGIEMTAGAMAGTVNGVQDDSRTSTLIAQSRSTGLRLDRSSGSPAIYIDVAGGVKRINQKVLADGWHGSITPNTMQRSIRGASSLEIPELGNALVSLTRGGDGLLVSVSPQDGRVMPMPVIQQSATGLKITFADRSASAAQQDPTQLQRLPQQRYVPPLQPRAVAPAVGDIAVSTTALPNPGLVDISGPRISVKYRQTPARQAFEDLVSRGGYGFVWVPADSSYKSNGSQSSSVSTVQSGFNPANPSDPGEIPISIQAAPASAGASGSEPNSKTVDTSRFVNVTMLNQPYKRVFNALLMATQLQAKVIDGIIYVGPAVAEKVTINRFARTYRLNQVSAASAADFLANLGAKVTKTVTGTSSMTRSEGSASGSASSDSSSSSGSANSSGSSQGSSSSSAGAGKFVLPYGSSTGPLIGLMATTDDRLQALTLIGSNELIQTAEQFLKKLDLRQRQVALSIKVLDIALDNVVTAENSFAFRSGNSFIVSDRGELVGTFGNYIPPNDSTFNTIAGGAASGKSEIVTLEEGQTQITQAPVDPAPINPGQVYSSDKLYDLVRARIQSSSAKVLVSPTLILGQESQTMRGDDFGTGGSTYSIGRPYGNEATVVVGVDEITGYTVIPGQNGAPNTCQPEYKTAGLLLGAKVSKVDDNGYVSFAMTPTISAVVGTGQSIAGCGEIRKLMTRSLSSGILRVRAGQTLILTGVISDSDQEVVRKWPILGDLPLIGQFFRGRSGTRQKNELVIMVTPHIIDDQEGGVYGYGYTPSRQAATQLFSN